MDETGRSDIDGKVDAFFSRVNGSLPRVLSEAGLGFSRVDAWDKTDGDGVGVEFNPYRQDLPPQYRVDSGLVESVNHDRARGKRLPAGCGASEQVAFVFEKKIKKWAKDIGLKVSVDNDVMRISPDDLDGNGSVSQGIARRMDRIRRQTGMAVGSAETM